MFFRIFFLQAYYLHMLIKQIITFLSKRERSRPVDLFFIFPFDFYNVIKKGGISMESTNILTVKEVAAYFKLSVITVYKLLKEGNLPGFKVGSSWRVNKEDLLNL